MITLYEVLKQADTDRVAIGHFNVSDLVAVKAVFEGARGQRVPVIIGVSEGSGNSSVFDRSPLWSGACVRNTTSLCS
jgi:fructose/tagatose bisphosphate aldolase